MTMQTTEKISHELQVALDQLRADIERVEIWASALSGFSKPVPDYEGGFHDLMLSARDWSERDDGPQAKRKKPRRR